MLADIGEDEISEFAQAGFYIALRVGFAFPVEEINNLPDAWVSHYTKQRYMIFDPVIRWVYSHTGTTRWSELALDDPKGVLKQAQVFGLRYGIAVSHFDGNQQGQRSYGIFTRSDREFTDLETKFLYAFVQRRHQETAPPTNLTNAELSALRMVKDGMRLKQIAHEIDISEGAVKQRLKNAKLKLEANTSTQAAAIASQFGLI